MKRFFIYIYDWIGDSFLDKNRLFYLACQRFVDRRNGRRNSDMETNGEIRLIKRNAKNWNIVFDIGANQGEWTRAVVRVNPHAKIHCFEPDKTAFKRLIENNFSSNIACNDIGLSSSKQDLPMYVFSDGSELNSLYKREGLELEHGAQNSSIEVKLDTLENYCLEKEIASIDFVKIDVEGHELEVLKGMKAMLEDNKIKVIQFEYGGCNIDSRVLLKDIFIFFKDFNYDIYKILPKKLMLIESYKEIYEDFVYSNYLVMQKKK